MTNNPTQKALFALRWKFAKYLQDNIIAEELIYTEFCQVNEFKYFSTSTRFCQFAVSKSKLGLLSFAKSQILKLWS